MILSYIEIIQLINVHIITNANCWFDASSGSDPALIRPEDRAQYSISELTTTQEWNFIKLCSSHQTGHLIEVR